MVIRELKKQVGMFFIMGLILARVHLAIGAAAINQLGQATE